ncbi:MAG: HAD family hydrolase [Thermomicrobiales bacterium]
MNKRNRQVHPDASAVPSLAVSRRRVLAGMAGGAMAGMPIAAAVLSGIVAAPVASVSANQALDSLPSWNEGPAKQALLDFLESVADPAATFYVPPEDRIATFDVDGTLWCEMSYPPQIYFMLDHIRQQAEAHPELRTVQPYKAVWEEDSSYFAAAAEAEAGSDVETLQRLSEELMAPFSGLTPAEYETIVRAFFDQSLHPELQVPYRQIIYQPMVELIQVLQANAFDVYVVTGSGRDFIRVISEPYFGISRANVIGSSIDLAYQTDEEGGVLVRQNTLDEPFDNGPGKPIRIEMQIGRQPILVGGNSDGDVAMLAYAQGQHSQFLGLLVHHDDADREYAYDRGAETALQLAVDHNWVVASMKEDFGEVFVPAAP